MTHHISDSNRARRNGQLIVAMLAMIAGAIMMGAVIATRYRFPQFSRQPAQSQSLLPFTTGLRDLPSSNPIRQVSQVASSPIGTGTTGKAPGSVGETETSPDLVQSEEVPVETMPAEEKISTAGLPADKAYAVGSGDTHKPISPLW